MMLFYASVNSKANIFAVEFSRISLKPLRPWGWNAPRTGATGTAGTDGERVR